MRELGHVCCGRTVYADLDADSTVRAIFEQDMDVERIIRVLELPGGEANISHPNIGSLPYLRSGRWPLPYSFLLHWSVPP